MSDETAHPAFHVNGDQTGRQPSEYTVMIIPENGDHRLGAHIANAELARQKLRDNHIPFEDDGDMAVGAHTVLAMKHEDNKPVTRLQIRVHLPAAQAWRRLKKAGFIPWLPSYH